MDPTKERELVYRFFYTLIIQPFVNFLKAIVDKGADPHATVQKLSFYRKLDEHMKHLQNVSEQRDAQAVVQDVLMSDEQRQRVDTDGSNRLQMIDTGRSNNHNQPVAVKKRTEVLAEQRFEKKAHKSRKNRDKKESSNPNDPKAQLKKQIKEFYAKHGHTPRYEKKGGKNVEIEYSKDFGKQNALHIIMREPALWIVQYFINELSLEMDGADI